MQKRKRNTPAQRRATRKAPGSNVLLWGVLGAASVAGIGYLGWRHYQAKKATYDTIVTDIPQLVPVAANPIRPSSGGDSFPLKNGSRGTRVRQLQQALIKKYGASILPKYGADGIIGSETLNALRSKGWPASVDEATYNLLVGSAGTSGNSPQEIADTLASRITSRDFAGTMATLQAAIKNTNDYTSVGDYFKQARIQGIRHTLVTALLKFFPAHKAQLNTWFNSIGLVQRNGQWALSGLGLLSGDLMTTRSASVWDNAFTTVSIPPGTIIGQEIESTGGYTRFLTRDNKELIIHTDAVRYV